MRAFWSDGIQAANERTFWSNGTQAANECTFWSDGVQAANERTCISPCALFDCVLYSIELVAQDRMGPGKVLSLVRPWCSGNS